MIHLGDFESAGVFAVTNSAPETPFSGAQPVNLDNPNTPQWRGRFYAVATVDIHIARNRAATINDTFIPAKTPFSFGLQFGDYFSWIEDATNGSIYIAKIST